MRKTPESLSNRPIAVDDSVDVFGQVLDAVHLTTAVYGRLELGSPWHLEIPARPYLSFYVIGRGSALLELPGIEPNGVLPLSVGDAVVLPHGAAHSLRDASRSGAPAQLLDYGACPQAFLGHAAQFGGNGPVTSIITGHFTFGSAPRNALLSSLPPAIHLPADAATRPPLGGIVPLILSESSNAGPGTGIALAHLADLLLIHSLRYWMAQQDTNSCGLRAVADPAIGVALRLMHTRPAHPWTVTTLAEAVAMSRSAFAERFTKLVGEPPLQYLARWRMTTAARMLGEHDANIAMVAEHVGYANPVAFTKAFTRMQGISPGAFRRQEHAQETQTVAQ